VHFFGSVFGLVQGGHGSGGPRTVRGGNSGVTTADAATARAAAQLFRFVGAQTGHEQLHATGVVDGQDACVGHGMDRGERQAALQFGHGGTAAVPSFRV